MIDKKDLEIVKIRVKVDDNFFVFYEDRFIIKSKIDGSVIDDAQSYGYKSYQSAQKAMWYKFDGGKKKIDSIKNEAKNFFRKNKDIAEFINNMYEINFKEPLSEEKIKEEVEKNFCITIKTSWLPYLMGHPNRSLEK